LKTKWINIIIGLFAVVTLAVIVATIVVDDNTANPSQQNAVTVADDKDSAYGKDLSIETEYQYFLQFTKNSILKQNNIDASDTAAVQKFWSETKYENKPILDTVKTYTLNSLKEYRVLLMKVKEKKLFIDKTTLADIDSKLNQEIQSYGSKPETAIKALYGVSINDYAYISKNLYLDYVILKNDTEKGIKVTDAEVKAYFDKNEDGVKDKLGKVTVRHILYLTQDSSTRTPLSSDVQAKAKKDAEDMLKKVKAGGDIAALAKEFSQDTGSKDNGGELTFKRGEMVKEFEDWSFKAKVGDVGLVKTQYGYHIIKLEAKINTYKELAPEIKSALIDKKYVDIVAGWKKTDESKVDVSSIK